MKRGREQLTAPRMVYQKGRSLRVQPSQEKSHLPSPGLALHPQESTIHLVVHYQGQQLIHEVDCKVHNPNEQSNAPGEERKLIKVSDFVGAIG